MDRKPVEVITSGVKCDNPVCDYLDVKRDIPPDIDGRRAFVGTPCPKCGASLLTQADFESYEVLMKIVDATNILFADFPEPEGGREIIAVRMNGSGEVALKRKP